jgi:hypothetical protein
VKSHGQAFEIMRERERLLMRCDAQRLELAETIDQLQGPLKAADRAVEGINYLRAHPLVFGAVAALLVVVGTRGRWSWLRRGFILWRAYRAFGSSTTA